MERYFPGVHHVEVQVFGDLRSPENARRLRKAAAHAREEGGEPTGLGDLRARLGLDET